MVKIDLQLADPSEEDELTSRVAARSRVRWWQSADMPPLIDEIRIRKVGS